MKKVGFFRSIQLKFIIIYILLLLVAMQVIGSYFAREIEEELLDNFYSSVDDRVDLLNYNLEQTFSRERDTDDGDPTLEQEVQSVVSEIDTTTISSLQVLNNQSRVIGTNDYFNRDIIGKRTTNNIIQETYAMAHLVLIILCNNKLKKDFMLNQNRSMMRKETLLVRSM